MRRKRLGIFLLFFCFLFSSANYLGIDTYAAGESNLISSDVTQWEYDSTSLDGSAFLEPQFVNGISCIGCYSMGTSSVYFAFDRTEIIAGHTYTLNFHIPSLNEINNAWSGFTQESLTWHLSDCEIYVGFGFRNDALDFTYANDSAIVFNSSTSGSMWGRNYSITYTPQNFTGTPCVVISLLHSGVVCFKRLIHHDMSKSLKTYKATKKKGATHEQTENNRPIRAFEP